MQAEYLGIEKIMQKDNYTFVIKWQNGVCKDYRLSQLQKQCPCHRCQGEKLLKVDQELKAKRIFSVGRYALKIEFASGCSQGIFTYRFLWEVGV